MLRKGDDDGKWRISSQTVSSNKVPKIKYYSIQHVAEYVNQMSFAAEYSIAVKQVYQTKQQISLRRKIVFFSPIFTIINFKTKKKYDENSLKVSFVSFCAFE